MIVFFGIVVFSKVFFQNCSGFFSFIISPYSFQKSSYVFSGWDNCDKRRSASLLISVPLEYADYYPLIYKVDIEHKAE